MKDLRITKSLEFPPTVNYTTKNDEIQFNNFYSCMCQNLPKRCPNIM